MSIQQICPKPLERNAPYATQIHNLSRSTHDWLRQKLSADQIICIQKGQNRTGIPGTKPKSAQLNMLRLFTKMQVTFHKENLIPQFFRVSTAINNLNWKKKQFFQTKKYNGVYTSNECAHHEFVCFQINSNFQLTNSIKSYHAFLGEWDMRHSSVFFIAAFLKRCIYTGNNLSWEPFIIKLVSFINSCVYLFMHINYKLKTMFSYIPSSPVIGHKMFFK